MFWKNCIILARSVGTDIFQTPHRSSSMIFLDTSYINSLIIKNDPYRQYAKEIRSILEKEK